MSVKSNDVKPTPDYPEIVETKDITDKFNRSGKAYTEKKFARAGKYEECHEDKAGQAVPKTGVYAEAGVGRVCAEYSVFEAEAKGPNASAIAESSMVGLGAIGRAELASASAKAGIFGVKVGLGVDTGVSIGAGGLEAKLLGTGVTIGPKTSVSVLGNEVSCSVM